MVFLAKFIRKQWVQAGVAFAVALGGAKLTLSVWPSFAAWLAITWPNQPIIAQIVILPPWSAAAMVFLFIIVLFLTLRVVIMTAEKNPRFTISFNSQHPCIDRQRVSVQEPITGQFVDKGMATYFRIRIEANSDTPIGECRAFITNIDVKKYGSYIFEPIPLPHRLWIRSESPIKVFPDVPEMADFLMCIENINKLQLIGHVPNSLISIFDEPATYAFTFSVQGDGRRRKIKVEVDWRGKYDNITARQVSLGV
jgi:hypothetical protein